MLPWRYERRAGLFCNRALKTGENFLMGDVASPRTDAGCPIRYPKRRERVSFMIHLEDKRQQKGEFETLFPSDLEVIPAARDRPSVVHVGSLLAPAF